jgi:hypothetical protein
MSVSSSSIVRDCRIVPHLRPAAATTTRTDARAHGNEADAGEDEDVEASAPVDRVPRRCYKHAGERGLLRLPQPHVPDAMGLRVTKQRMGGRGRRMRKSRLAKQWHVQRVALWPPAALRVLAH